MGLKKYRVRLSGYFNSTARVIPVTVEKETKKSVWIEGRRHLKRSNWYSFFDSFEEAKSALFDHRLSHIKCLEAQLIDAKRILKDIGNLYEQD